MILKWKAGLIFSAALILTSSVALADWEIRKVTYLGSTLLSPGELGGGAFLRKGVSFSDSLLGMELGRIDSLYFSYGRLAWEVEVDTFIVEDVVDVRLAISEGSQTTIGRISISGSETYDKAEVARLLGVAENDPFDPVALEGSMRRLLGVYNNSGYPYAQVWLTGFVYREEANAVDLSFSILEGGRAVISRLVFDGLVRTDTTLAVRTSRLSKGSVYNEDDVRRAGEYLRASGLFESVGEEKIERSGEGKVNVVIPVKEKTGNNIFQGAFGFSKKDGGAYVLNGSIELGLANIAGTGRDVFFSWLNDGEKYSRVELRFTELFLFSLPVHLDGEIRQVVQDTLYTWHSGGLYFRIPIKPGFSVLAGAAADRNVPGSGELSRSIRQRYRLGFRMERRFPLRLEMHAEGAYKKNYFKGGRNEGEGQLLCHIEGDIKATVIGRQNIYLRFVSESVFSSKDIPPAERFPFGGARTLRGYRENQFRGDKIVYFNIEYRFGDEGRLFLFDDIGAFYRAGERWTAKNGLGFGLRSSSPLGVIVLSFGVGERLSLEGTRIHISLSERF
ncbi:MAG: BamA/TamA family outer membrane protein [Candidatus Krumholzibacteria bacterium]|nr:BamA/TamA family outer membrane protein [Candidatus Krumholzibacteria bacterium]